IKELFLFKNFFESNFIKNVQIFEQLKPETSGFFKIFDYCFYDLFTKTPDVDQNLINNVDQWYKILEFWIEIILLYSEFVTNFKNEYICDKIKSEISGRLSYLGSFSFENTIYNLERFDFQNCSKKRLQDFLDSIREAIYEIFNN